jgi:hypothetical protein
VLSDPANAPVLNMLKHPRPGGGSGAGVLDDSSFIQHIDPRLAEPFKVGFTGSMHIVFLLGAAVMVLAFLVAAWTKEVPLRKVSGLEARAAAERGAATPGAGAMPIAAVTGVDGADNVAATATTGADPSARV